MKKLFLVLTPIIFLFCLNIGIQAASAVDCGSCGTCTAWDCADDDYVCTSWVDVCQGWDDVCQGYGDVCGGWEDICESGWETVCQNWSIGVCQGWTDVCEAETDCCPGGVNVSTMECIGGWQICCSLWGNECTGGFADECTGGWVDHCALWGNECTGGWSYECTSWESECSGGWESECADEEYVCYEEACSSCSPICSGSDSDCGCASCADCNAQDGCVGADYHDYSCSGNSCSANVIANASGCKTCSGPADCTNYSVGECIDASSKISSAGCNANGNCFYTTASALEGGATTLKDGGLYQYNSCDGSYYLLYQPNGQSCEAHCEGNNLYVPGIWESGIDEGCNWNIESCGSCGCSASGCVADGSFDCPDFCEDSNLFTNGLACGGLCIYAEPLHCDHGCASPDCKYAAGGCAASCTGYTCGNAECSGCPFCSVSCPDVCFGSIYETGGYVSNNENSNMACFYADEEWCGDGCCGDPSDPSYAPPEPPSCYWGDKGCGGAGCDPVTEKGKVCEGVIGCTENVCALGDIECVLDASCSGGGPVVIIPLNISPVAVIDCLDNPSDPPPCTIYTDETITFQGGNSYDNDGFIASYSWNVLGSSYNGVNCMPSATPEGNYTATLTVTDNEGATGAVSKNFTVIQALVADFNWEPEFPIRNEEVDFTDLSAGDIISWSWTFEDGDVPAGEESERHPENIKFTSQGLKEVTLTITDSLSNSVSETKYIDVRIPMPNWRETHPGQEWQQHNQQGPGQYGHYRQQNQQSCREKCKSIDYRFGICRTFNCKPYEKDIGKTFDCKKGTCCCRY